MKTFGAWLRVLGLLLIIVLGVVQIVLLMLWLDFARLLDNEIVWLEEDPPPTMDALYLNSSFLN